MTFYDVFTLTTGEYLGRMPMRTLSIRWGLRKPAEERVERETQNNGQRCELFFNNSRSAPIAVQLAPADWAPPTLCERTE